MMVVYFENWGRVRLFVLFGSLGVFVFVWRILFNMSTYCTKKRGARSEFRDVKEWIPISSLLESYPIREIPDNSSEAEIFWSSVKLR